MCCSIVVIIHTGWSQWSGQRASYKRPHILIASVEFLSSTEVQESMSKFPTVEFLTRWGTRSVIVASHLGTGRLWSTLLTSARFFCRFCSCSEIHLKSMPREGSRRQDARLRLYQLELHQPAGKESCIKPNLACGNMPAHLLGTLLLNSR